MTVEDRRVSMGVGVSVAQRQAAGPFISSQIKSLTVETATVMIKIAMYTMATRELRNINSSTSGFALGSYIRIPC